jgi:hypothetical protein
MTEQKRKSRGVSADMSPEAVYRRLMITAELHELASLLGEAKPTSAPAKLPAQKLGTLHSEVEQSEQL